MKTIKKNDSNAQILIIGHEASDPYSRPPLSKELWDSSDEDLQDLMFKDYTGDKKSIFYDSSSIVHVKETDDLSSTDKVYFLNGSVSSIDTAEESIKLSSGAKIKYGKLLIATGGSPKILPVVKDLPKESRDRVMTFRGVSFYILTLKIDDFKKLYQLQQAGNKTIAIVGGGFLGSELAVALSKKGIS
jgi:programmed cell death 8 (apoptosis-inducing factor)